VSDTVLKFNNIGKKFGYQWAVRSATGEWKQGDYVSLFGKNGAGKSTLLYLISGVYRPHEGSISFSNGFDNKKFNRCMQLMSHQSMFYHRMSARDNLFFFESLYDTKVTRSEVDTALDFAGLLKAAGKTIDGFSRGMLQRLMIARVILARPSILFLDEPFTGLDIQGQNLLIQILENRGLSIFNWKIDSYLFVDHDLERAYRYCDKIWLIENGKLLMKETKDKISLKEIEGKMS